MKFLVLGFLALLGLSLPANAENTVQANRSTVVYDVAVWHPHTCATFGKMRHKISAQPQHGRLDIRFEMSRAKNIPSSCEGKVRGMQVIYTPDRGYRGPDSFVVSVTTPRYEGDGSPIGRSLKAKFTVK
ncbi:hypothetical protein LL06_20480 [Hoeflea sp. BAL378]|uniref:Ig-like domain-containing protein n=1 Tax=Hoeflea sp. BAL378 TaxID=1547437 RepID=UPI000514098B|nr:Ig-like domain-containing protein [Hoeflea sp. BAL378]KGF67723.1 hypothetical protein LL06_20480 [Hoeflea sp. BAL378]